MTNGSHKGAHYCNIKYLSLPIVIDLSVRVFACIPRVEAQKYKTSY